ncbi:MAG: CheB methylesterase domain-containing protein [Defluviitaleaceae bacterium]|nr:CheB methylesterase domain-containing protein [Defluviitaleaceae bacterium]
MIYVAIVADSTRQPFLEKCIQAQEDMAVIYSTDSINQGYSRLEGVQAIVLDVYLEDAKLFLSAIKVKKIPTIAIVDAASQGFSALEWGASAMMLRNTSQPEHYFANMLSSRIRNVVKKEGDGDNSRILKHPNLSIPGNAEKIIAIGSSTGGTDTLEHILRDLPENSPPILIVQHMPPVFTRMFAERLHNSCRISVWEARNNDPLTNGLAYVAPGNYHMVLDKQKGNLIVKCTESDRVCNQRPSVDVLFDSIVTVLGNDCSKVLGVILTGMGSDGANGLLAMRNMGSTTIGQDEASCVVYGMPRAAYECGAVQQQLHIDNIAQAIIKFANI